MPGPWDARHFVFVGGLHRSGTTYVADLLRDEPRAACLENTSVSKDEGQFLQDVYPTGAEMGGSTRWTRDPRFHLVEADADLVPDAAERIWAGWSPYLSSPDSTHVVEKTPQNLTKTRFLQRLFPHSSFVVVTRHPITQALAHSKWMDGRDGKLGRELPDLIEQWVRAHEAFQQDASSLRRLLVLRFENVMAHPEQHRRDIFDFLGFEAPTAPLEPVDLNRVREYDRRWQAALRRGSLLRTTAALPARIGRHQGAARDLSDALTFPRFRREIRRRFGERIQRLGYDLDVLDDARSW